MFGLKKYLVLPKYVHLDTLAVTLFAVITSLFSIHYEVFESIIIFAARHENLELDEGFSVLIITSFSLIILSYLRGKRLQVQIELREQSEEVASTLARHDPLTGLPNRRLLQEQFFQARARVDGNGHALAVLLIDLDRFKPVNDVHGHAAGDLVLTEIAHRMLHLVQTTGGSLLARLGGDEFAWVLEYDADTDAPSLLANEIINLASTPIDLEVVDTSSDRKARNVQIGASIGIATDRGSGLAMNEMLRMADVAMYQAKRDGRAAFRDFQPEMDVDLQTQAALQTELRTGLQRQEVIPYYQPIFSIPDHMVVGFEVLARWNHPDRGFLMPDVFIPIAEDCQLINELTFSLLRRACADASNWPPHLTLSINISPVQLLDAWLPQRLLQILTECGFSAGRLIVELTESAIIQDMDACRTIIASLKNAGVKVALDDFGTGYSSLSHLRELQFDSIKIDRSFVREMDSSRDEELVKAIIGMGHSLGMGVTAEGVETEGDLSTLIDLDCTHAQGFLFGRATSAAGALRLLSQVQHDEDQRRVLKGRK